jgi:hypothetical protein
MRRGFRVDDDDMPTMTALNRAEVGFYGGGRVPHFSAIASRNAGTHARIRESPPS